MKKVILAASLLLASFSSSFAQSNTAGTIHVGLGFGTQLGIASIKDDQGSNTGVGARFNYGVRASYGVAKLLSLGIYLRKEVAAYSIASDGEDDQTIIQNAVAVGLEPKFYVVNRNKFNLYLAPSLGFVSGKTYDNDDSSIKDKTTGLGYGATIGFNWYWAKFIGMSVDLGYNGLSTNAKSDLGNYKLSSNGLYFGVGLVSKFGGK